MRNIVCQKLALERMRFHLAQISALFHASRDEENEECGQQHLYDQSVYRLLVTLDQDVELMEHSLEDAS